MPDFRYAARDRQGQTVRGALTAPNRKAALATLAREGLIPVELRDATSTTNPSGATPEATPGAGPAAAPKLSSRQLNLFWSNLLQLTSGGLSAAEAVRLLGARMEDAVLRQLAMQLWRRLSEGDQLSSALAAYPELFDREAVQLIRAGEATGHLGESLARVNQLRRERADLRRMLIEALTYPVFVCLAAGAVVLLFIFVLLPRIEQLLLGLGNDLPWATQALVSLSRGAVIATGPVLLVLIGAAIALWRWQSTPAGKAKADALLLDAPLAGPALREASSTQMFQTLAGLLENGIPLAEALLTAAEGVGNTEIRRRLRRSVDDLLEGRTLAAAFRDTKLFPPLVTDRLAAGEEAGRLAVCLRELGREQQAAWSARMRWITQLFSIAVLLLTFALVAFVAWAIVSAVFQVSSSLRA